MTERVLDWDDEITKDSSNIVLPEGEYDFVVKSLERGRSNGSEKMPSCPMAILTLEIYHEGMSVQIKHNLLLHSKFEGRIGEFFMSIGLKKKNEPLRMNWNAVVGTRGRCRLGTHQYNGNEYNQVKKFLEPENTNVGYRPGTF